MPSHYIMHDYVRVTVARETVGAREESPGSQRRA